MSLLHKIMSSTLSKLLAEKLKYILKCYLNIFKLFRNLNILVNIKYAKISVNCDFPHPLCYAN